MGGVFVHVDVIRRGVWRVELLAVALRLAFFTFLVSSESTRGGVEKGVAERTFLDAGFCWVGEGKGFDKGSGEKGVGVFEVG